VQLAVVRESNQAVQLDAAWHASVLQDASPADFKRRAQQASAAALELRRPSLERLSSRVVPRRARSGIRWGAHQNRSPNSGEESGLSRSARSKRGYPRGRASCDGTSINSDGATFHP